MTEIKKLIIKAQVAPSESKESKEPTKKTNQDSTNVPILESLEEKLSDFKVEIAEMVERKIEQYHRKNNKH